MFLFEGFTGFVMPRARRYR